MAAACNYVVSAQRPTLVAEAVVGHFTADDHLNLLLNKTNRIEVMLVTSEGLKPVKEIPVFGRITATKLFRVEGETRDSLLILTAKYHLAILAWDPETGEVITRASGHVAERVGRPSDTGVIACIHASGLIALRIYDGMLKVIEWSEGKDLKATNLRFEDLTILDLAFLENAAADDASIRMAYIYQDNNGRHLKTMELHMGEKEMKRVSHQDNIENEASMLIPIPAPYGGVVAVGQETIVYNRENNSFVSIAPPHIHQTQFTCYGKIDAKGERFLLADLSGRLFMLVLDADPTTHVINDLKVELLGETSIAECVAYLDNAVVFVGSRFGDSQLIRLTTEPIPTHNTFIEVLETFTNLAPIRDMAVVETDGQNQLITCSGAFKDGSLRIIRNGIGIEEAASVDLPGVNGLFALSVDSEFDNYLVVSLVDETHILHINGEELEDTQLLGLETSEQSLWAGCVGGEGCVLQVTPSGARLARAGAEPVVWHPPKQEGGGVAQISLVAVNAKSGQVVLVCGETLHYATVFPSGLTLHKSRTMQYEVACVDVSSIDDSGSSSLVAVGLWTEMSAVLLSLPGLDEVVVEKIGGDMLPRSILLARMDCSVYLLVAMGDGSLNYWTLDGHGGTLRDPKRATLGTQPTQLHAFHSRGNTHVFACSDRPAVVYCASGKLVFSNVNLKLVTQMCALNADTYRDSLVMSDGETLVIGTVDDIQKLHIRTVPLGESVSRIAHQPETGTVCVLTSRDESSERLSVSRMAAGHSASKVATARSGAGENVDGEIHSVVLLDANTFEILHSHELGANEHATSIHSTKLGDDMQVYYIVGTALVYPDESESKVGRLLVFRAGVGEERNKMHLVTDKETKGAAFSMSTLNGKLIVAINSSVRLFEWTPEKELRLECSHFNYITALYLKTKNDLVLVGDLMRSLCLLSYKNMESSFEELARDFVSHWMSACEIIDSEVFLGAESNYNLFTVEKDTQPANADERQKLQEGGYYYLGETVNVLRRGWLVPPQADSQLPVDRPILYGTIDGSIGLIVQMEQKFHKFVSSVESAVAKSTSNCLRIQHSTYRAFQNERQNLKPIGFIDGDLVETVLEWPRDKQEKVLSSIRLPEKEGGMEVDEQEGNDLEEIVKTLEDLSRIH